ncbi:MAG: hypothetical protein F4Y03_09325 [Alphaproteobacteria bacterium]|nr:hypothetical protein [Alphaproteobacteria bacterium]
MAWPAYANVTADGYGKGRDRDVERTPFDDGMVGQEKRFDSAARTRRVRGWLASDADQVRFEAWAEREAHTWFAWTDTEDGAQRQARVRNGAAGIRYAAVVRDGRRTWDFELELEGPST